MGDHENIIKILDTQINNIKEKGFEVFLLLELCPHGTLFDAIEQQGKNGLQGITNEKELVRIINDVSNGLKFMHSKKITHRDIKIENILLGNDEKWKICDFGSSTLKKYDGTFTS